MPRTVKASVTGDAKEAMVASVSELLSAKGGEFWTRVNSGKSRWLVPAWNKACFEHSVYSDNNYGDYTILTNFSYFTYVRSTLNTYHLRSLRAEYPQIR